MKIRGVLVSIFVLMAFLITGCSTSPGSSTSKSNSSSVSSVSPSVIGWIGGGYSGWQTGTGTSYSNGEAYFYWPSSVYVDSSGNIYVADDWNNRICKWNSSGIAQGWIGGGYSGWQTGSGTTTGNGEAYFNHPEGVCVDGSGNIYIEDYWNNRICKWNSSGIAQGWIGGGYSGWQTNSGTTNGSGEAYFTGPIGVCVDGSGNIYVADLFNNRICKWNSSGIAQGWIGGGYSGWQTNSGTTNGSGEAYFYYPEGVCVDGSGNIYVADLFNNRICKWNSPGVVQGWIGGGYSGWQTNSTASLGSGEAYFNAPMDVYIDGSGNIYVADYSNNRICKWH
jgi:sugar lactone lactonase YvrE